MEVPDIDTLKNRIEELEKENAILRQDFNSLSRGDAVIVPEEMKPLFDKAQKTVQEYFKHFNRDPTKGTIEINDQRYLLVRASALSKDFLDTIQNLYADRGEHKALAIGKNFLFDIAHVIGMNDARNFHAKMNLTDPIAKLSAGPVHFAHTGWAFVDILPESRATPDENFYLIYQHPYSFEADSWIRSGKQSDTPICIMNSGYSSGWCEESFGIPLTAVEVSCTAKGDEHCTFIMSPPNKIQEHLERFHTSSKNKYNKTEDYEIPTFFDRKRVEEEMHKSRILAEESAKSKADFVANMSHELRTPLGSILGFCDLMKKTILSHEQSEYLQAISVSGESLLSIINNILDLSKLDAGKFFTESRPFNLSELMRSVQVMFAEKAKNKGLRFTMLIDSAIDSAISGDAMRVRQILTNLIGNAIKFTEMGRVDVSCVTEHQDAEIVQLCFTVKDTGIGIPEDKIEAIFERFTQADTNTTRKYGGTGLGLSITKQLVELLGGSIQVESEIGKGSEFSLRLHFRKSSEEMHNTEGKDATPSLQYHSVKRVLVVEDTLLNQKLTSIILQNNGFEIMLAENGKKAIEILQTQVFDLILMDIQMPEMDGYEATCIIRERLRVNTPIIAMTAHALAGEREKCFQKGISDYLAKPFTENDLLFKISHWIKEEEPVSHSKLTTAPVRITDISFLKKQTRNKASAIAEMIRIFNDQNPRDIATLQNAIEKSDFATIYQTAHVLKTETSMFGLRAVLSTDLTTMEELAREGGGMQEIKDCFARVKQVCEQAVMELRELNIDK